MPHKRILIDCTMHLGDMITTSVIIPVIKHVYPDSEIHYIAKKNVSSIVELFPHVDKVVPYEYKSKGGYLDVYRWGMLLKRERYDISIAIEPRRRTAIMKWLARIPIRISFGQIWKRKVKQKRFLYTEETQLSNWDVEKNRVSESAFEIAKRAFSVEDLKYFYPKLLSPSLIDSQFIKNLLADNGVYDDNLKVVFCVKTLDVRRNWASQNFSLLGDWLSEKYNASIIFAGLPSDEEIVANIRNGMKYKDKTVTLIGKTTIKEVSALFHQVKLLVTLDTGMAHLAAASGCQTVTIFGNSNPERNSPAGKNCVIVSSKGKPIENVTVEMVQNTIANVLN